MHFGVFDHLDNIGQDQADYYEDRLQLIALYDRLGFHGYHLAEHHGTPLGMAPSPNVFLSAIAQRTKRLRFGPMVYALPLYHPLRLAQEICMLDQLSRGRLDIGFGRGSSPIEQAYFGISAADAETIHRDFLTRILDALATGVMEIPGQSEPFNRVTLSTRPTQRPHPPVWYGVHSPDSAARAAQRGLHTINLDTAEDARACNDVYRASFTEDAPLPLLGLGRFIVVAETDDEALAIARRAYPHWHDAFTRLSRAHGRIARHPRPADWDSLVAEGKGIAGTPATVTDFLRAQLTTSQSTYCVGQFAFGDQTAREAQRSVKLFADDVIPALRDVDRAFRRARAGATA